MYASDQPGKSLADELPGFEDFAIAPPLNDHSGGLLAELVVVSSHQQQNWYHSGPPQINKQQGNWANDGPTYQDLIDELMAPEEPMDQNEMANHTGEPGHLAGLKKPSTTGQVVLCNDDVEGVSGGTEVHVMQHLVATEAQPQPEAETKVQVTQEPEMLSQANFPKPWEQEEPLDQRSCSSDASSTQDDAESSKADLDHMADYIKKVLSNYDNIVQANKSNGKIQVHQVVLLLLLANDNDDIKMNLGGILVFCDSDGKPSNKRGKNFRTKDTKAMGLIWQKIKENRNANYDTFARAMRVGRERNKEYFDYLETGKSSKKRVYKLGPKAGPEMRKMEEMLKQIC